MQRLKLAEAKSLLSPHLSQAMAIHGYTPVASQYEHFAYAKPASDGLFNLVTFSINGWNTSTLYLALNIGINEPQIAQQIIRICHLGGVTSTTLMLCGTPAYHTPPPAASGDSSPTLVHWNLTPNSDFQAIAHEAANAAIEHVQQDLTQCQTLPGLHHVLKNFRAYPAIRQFDDGQMQDILPLIDKT